MKLKLSMLVILLTTSFAGVPNSKAQIRGGTIKYDFKVKELNFANFALNYFIQPAKDSLKISVEYSYTLKNSVRHEQLDQPFPFKLNLVFNKINNQTSQFGLDLQINTLGKKNAPNKSSKNIVCDKAIYDLADSKYLDCSQVFSLISGRKLLVTAYDIQF